MQLRDSLFNTKGKYSKQTHRHPRPNFKSFIYFSNEIDCQSEDVAQQKILPFGKSEHGHIYKFKINSQLKIILNQDIVGRLSNRFIDLYNAINFSKYILDFKDDWDSNGSKAYLSTTWIKATKFLIKFYNWREHNSKPFIKSPKIYQGPEGSIDIYWKTEGFTYLINIPEEEVSASFYYKSPTGAVIEGEFDLKQFQVDELPSYFESNFL